MSYQQETIWIIGASEGIGKAVSYALAKAGTKLIVSGRREQALQTLAAGLPRPNDQKHAVQTLDLAETNQLAGIVSNVVQAHGVLGRVLIFAAVYQPTSVADMDIGFAKTLLDINLLGPMALTQALLPYLTKQAKAQLVICASSAGYLGLPNGQPYSASKAGLINFAESLAAEVPKHIDIKVINSGFVKTRLTAKNAFPMPLAVDVDKAAQIIVRGLSKRSFEMHFPRLFTYAMKALSNLPYMLMIPLCRLIKR